MNCRVLKIYFVSLYSPRAIVDRLPSEQEGSLEVSKGAEVGRALASRDVGGCFVDEGILDVYSPQITRG